MRMRKRENHSPHKHVMTNGRAIKNHEWDKYLHPHAMSHLEHNCREVHPINGCGSLTLSTLCGDGLIDLIRDTEPRFGWWNDRSMIRFLQKHGFKAKEVTRYGITSISPEHSAHTLLDCTFYHLLKPHHVILGNLLMCRGEASWFIITGNKVIHNQQIYPLTPLFFLNHPPQSVYLLGNDKWNAPHSPIATKSKSNLWTSHP